MSPTEKQRRGQAIKRRREAHGIKSLRQMVERTGIARGTLTKIEAGFGTEESTAKVEEFLNGLDAEAGIDTTIPDPEPGEVDETELIEFDVSGPRTEWRVVVRGPVDQADELRHQAAELLREMESRD